MPYDFTHMWNIYKIKNEQTKQNQALRYRDGY